MKEVLVVHKIMKNKSGFTLLEVLVVIGILSVFLLSAVTVSIVSIRNLKNSENKILASRYAEGLIEWLRGEKENNWDGVDGLVSKATGDKRCFVEPLVWPASIGDCNENQKINNLFYREAIITYNVSSERITINATVSWGEGDEEVTVPINTIFEHYDEK